MENKENLVILVTSDQEKTEILNDNRLKRDLYHKLKIATSELELFTLIFENTNNVKAIILSEEINFSSIKEIYFNIHRTGNLFNFPILFKLSSENKLADLKELGIPNINVTINDNFEYSIRFIEERIKAYKDYCDDICSNHYFSGTLSNHFGIINLISLISLSDKTGTLILKKDSGNLYFEIFFENGELVYAYEDNGYFPLNGMDVIIDVFQITELNKINYDFMSDIKAPGKHFSESTKNIIAKVYKNLNPKISTIPLNTNELKRIANETYKNNKKQGEIIKPMSTSQKFDDAIEIAEDIFWVSERNPNSLLQLNSYLRVFKKENRSVNMLIDPGAIEFFPAISKKVSQIISDVSKINMYSINHQDPDVGMNATFLSRINPKSVCLCTEDTWRLVQFYEIPKNTYKNVYSFEDKKVSISTDPKHVIEFIPTPYCHFVGAFALYDKATRVLFTGDLFGGLNPANNLSLFATEEHWEGIKVFHQIYMPSKIGIRNAIDSIRNMPEKPLMIVPQHGAILAGDIMDLFLNRLYNLEVGLDLLNKVSHTKLNPVYIEIMNMIYTKLLNYIGENEIEKLFEFNNKSQELFYLVDMDINGVKDIYSQHERALNLMIGLISKYKDSSLVNEIKSMAIKETLFRQLPMPLNIYSDATESLPNSKNELYIETEEKENDNIFV